MIAIIDYEAGNLTSVHAALTHVGGVARIVNTPSAIDGRIKKIVFPGVGSAASCMANLRRRGWDKFLRAAVAAQQPLLAICIGMQLLFENSAEDGDTECLGILRGQVRRFIFPPAAKIKVPHMGWNEIMPTPPATHPLFANLPPHSEAYFVHSYYVEPANAEEVIALTEYGGQNFVSAVARGNLWATQFHPEKSGEVGLQMLRNFVGAMRDEP